MEPQFQASTPKNKFEGYINTQSPKFNTQGGYHMDSKHIEYMQRAITLAKKGMGKTTPNPMVGCVVVKDGRIISEGYHERYGEFHAERNALTRCEEDASGADLYVTLEPCCHYGKTPPCTEIIIEKKIKRVFIGSMDPNPLVAGKGAQILRDHGIEVFTDVLKNECDEMNDIFLHYISEKRPFVALKYAMTLDGKIAAYTTDSKWITNEKSREHVHYLRNKYTSIMVGIGTVLADDPMLNCRIEDGTDPIRIILDTKLRIPMDSNIVKTARNIRTIIFCHNGCDEYAEKMEELISKGIEIKQVSLKDNSIDIKEVFDEISSMKIDSVLVEGGATVNASLVEEKIVDKVYCYIAPKIIGGEKSKSPVGGVGIPFMKDALKLKEVKFSEFDGDILIEGKVDK